VAHQVIDPESPDAVVNRIAVAREAAIAASQTVERVRGQLDDVGRPLRAALSERLVLLAEDGLLDADATTAPLPEQLSALKRCVAEAAAQLEGFDAAAARAEVVRLTQQVETGRAGVEQLRELIARAEDEVIASAKVVATTLTSAYLRDAIVNRRFDVVLLDEASRRRFRRCSSPRAERPAASWWSATSASCRRSSSPTRQRTRWPRSGSAPISSSSRGRGRRGPRPEDWPRRRPG